MTIKIPVKSKAAYNKTKTPPKKLIKIPIKKKILPQPFIDRITLIFDIEDKAEAEEIHSVVWGSFNDEQNFQATKSGPGFQIARRIYLETADNKKHFPILQYRHYEKLAQRFRLTLSPVDLSLESMMHLHISLQSLFEGGWCRFIKNAHVTMIEVSVDLPGIAMPDIHPLPHQTTTVKTYSNAGNLQTIYLGKKSGNQYRIYDRAEKRNAKQNGWLVGECTRVERVLRNQKMMFSGLAKMENPFSAIGFVNLPQSPPPGKQNEYVWPLFCDSAEKRTLPVALKLLPPNTKRKEYRKWLQKHPKQWWDPNAIWDNWPKMLTETHLLDVGYWDL